MRLTVAAAIAILTTADTASAQQDPYATSDTAHRQAQYRAEAKDYFANIRLIYFGVGCQVMPDEGSVLPLTYLLHQHFWNKSLMLRILDPNLDGLHKKAAADGMARAKTEGCAFWHQNPDAVATLRQSAEAAVYAQPR